MHTENACGIEATIKHASQSLTKEPFLTEAAHNLCASNHILPLSSVSYSHYLHCSLIIKYFISILHSLSEVWVPTHVHMPQHAFGGQEKTHGSPYSPFTMVGPRN